MSQRKMYVVYVIPFNRGNKDERDKIKETYEKHIAEKQAVRKVKEVLKSTVIDLIILCIWFVLIKLFINSDNSLTIHF